MQRQGAEPGEARGVGSDRLGDPVIGDARQPQAGLRIGPFEALMDEARAQHLDVDAHGIHPGDPVLDVAHPREHQAGAVLDALPHRVGDARVGGQFGEDVVLGGERIDLGHDDMSVHVDRRRAPALRRLVRQLFGHGAALSTQRYDRIFSLAPMR